MTNSAECDRVRRPLCGATALVPRMQPVPPPGARPGGDPYDGGFPHFRSYTRDWADDLLDSLARAPQVD